MEHQELLNAIGILLFLSLISQYLGNKFKIPTIVLLTLFGLAIGPFLNLVNPEKILGHLFHIVMEFAIVILLFEGGLNLRFKNLQGAGRGLKQLIGFGIFTNWIITTLAAHYIGELPWSLSFLIGAVLTVTGPTVIIPCLRQVSLPRKINQYFKWEGIVNDPIGVLLATLVYKYITYQGSSNGITLFIFGMIKAIGLAVLITFIFGYSIRYLFNKTRFPDFLKIPSILSFILLVYILLENAQDGSGLLAVAMLGMYFANNDLLVMAELRRFKESISIFSVSIVFLLLTASIKFELLKNLGLRHILFILAVVFLTRLIAVYISTIGSKMSFQEKTLVGWFGPRGIVAASMAGILGLKLIEKGYPDADLILPIIFSVICLTVLIHSFSLEPLAKFLKLTVKEKKGLLIVGAYPWTTDLANILQEIGVPVLLSDLNRQRIREAKLLNIKTHFGEIIVDAENTKLDLSEYSYLLAATDNNSFNALVCNSLADVFGRNNIFQIPLNEAVPIEVNKITKLPSSQGGLQLDDKTFQFEEIEKKYYSGWTFKKTPLTQEYNYETLRRDSQNLHTAILMAVHEDGSISFAAELLNFKPKPGDILITFKETNKQMPISEKILF
jgi:NhaP-type Na+/H+ or K+/H+ antiporter